MGWIETVDSRTFEISFVTLMAAFHENGISIPVDVSHATHVAGVVQHAGLVAGAASGRATRMLRHAEERLVEIGPARYWASISRYARWISATRARHFVTPGPTMERWLKTASMHRRP